MPPPLFGLAIDIVRFSRVALERSRGQHNNSSSGADGFLQEAESRLRQAKQREAAAAELEEALQASRAELSRREEALALSTTEAYRTAFQGDDRAPHRSSGGRQAAVPSPGVAGDGVSPGVSRGGQGWTSGMQSLTLGSPIREASPSSHVASGPSWGGAAVGGPGEGESRDIAAAPDTRREPSAHWGQLDVEARERQLEEWSNALAEQAEAMREQALRLETAYDRLREREAESSSSQQAPPKGQHGCGGAQETKIDVGGGPPPPQHQRSGSSHERVPDIAVPPSAAAAGAAAAASVVADGSNNGDASHDVGESNHQQPIESRQLEQETVRLAEKARELDAERRRLRLAAESADREHARAQAERQEASDARRDAAALRVELERERTRLDAEKGGLAAERSLLAAERGRIATERARSRRENDGNVASGDAAVTTRKAAQLRSEKGVGGTSGLSPAVGDAGEAAGLAGTREGNRFAGPSDTDTRAGEGVDSHGFGAHPAPDSATTPVGFAAASGAEPPRPADLFIRREISAGGSGGTGEAETSSPRAAATKTEAKPGDEPASRAGFMPGRPAVQPQELAPSATPVVRQLSSQLVQEPGVARASGSGQGTPATRDSREGGTGSVGGSDSVGGPAGDRAESVEEQGAVRATENDSSPRSSEPGQRRRDDDDDDGADAEPPRSDRRSGGTRTALQGVRSRENREARRVNASPPPSIASVRRRLQGAGGSRRGGRGEHDTADSSDDDSSSSAATPVRRRSESAAGAAAAGRSGNRSNSVEPLPLRSSPRSGSGRGRALGHGQSHRSIPEDPFLAQLHARLAGADHTLRQSLGRREALLSRFGGTDGSSVAPTSEGDTSDQNANAHSSASVAVSLDADAAASSSSSPPDGAERRGADDGVARSDRGSGLGLESSPDTDTRGGRFGYTGRGARGGGQRRVLRRAEHENGHGRAVQRRQQSGLAPAVVMPASEPMTPVSGTMSPARRNTSAAEAFSTPSAARGVAREARSGAGAGAGEGASQNGAGYRRQAGSDTDDTEAEKENLRELMLALGADDMHDGAVDGDEDGDGDDEGRRGHPGTVEESRGERSRDGNTSAADGIEDTVGDPGAFEEEQEHGYAYERRHEEERRRGGDAASTTAAATGEADAGGGNTLMSSLRAQNEDISSRLQDMSLQVSQLVCSAPLPSVRARVLCRRPSRVARLWCRARNDTQAGLLRVKISRAMFGWNDNSPVTQRTRARAQVRASSMLSIVARSCCLSRLRQTTLSHNLPRALPQLRSINSNGRRH